MKHLFWIGILIFGFTIGYLLEISGITEVLVYFILGFLTGAFSLAALIKTYN